MDGLGLLLIIFLIAAAAAYFLPSIFAWTRNHPSKWGIIALNILLGWTLLGLDYRADLVFEFYKAMKSGMGVIHPHCA